MSEANVPLLNEEQIELKAWKPDIGIGEHVTSVKNSFTKRIACLTSYGWPLYLKQVTTATFSTMDPILKGRTMYALIRPSAEFHDPCWAFITFSCVLLPLILMYIAMNAKTSRQQAFFHAFECQPKFFNVVAVHFRMLVRNLIATITGKGKLTRREQVYMKLMALFAVSEQSCFTSLQTWILVRQNWLPYTVIRWKTVLPAVFSALFNMFMALDFFKTYAGICTEGNMREFLEILLDLGEGAAPPTLLMSLRSEKEVVVEDDLSSLNVIGYQSVFKAIKSSVPLQSLTFKKTGIDRFHFDYGPVLWGNGIIDLASNRGELRTVIFDPAVDLPKRAGWNFNSCLRLETVRNGNGEETFEITVDRTKGDGLGISFGHGDERTLLIEEIEEGPGLIGEWNKSCDFRKEVNKDDRIIEVNGMSGDALQLVEELKKEQILLMKIKKAKVILYSREAQHPKTALRDAIDADDAEKCKAALAVAGAKATKKDFSLAVRCDHWRALCVMIQKAPPSTTEAARYLVSAAYAGSTACVQLLLYWRVDAGAKDPNGRTPLHMASSTGRERIVALLLGASASATAVDNVGSSVLQASAHCDNATVAKKLLDARANVHARDNIQRTPLHDCAHHGWPSVTDVLITAKADVDAKDDENNSPLIIAAGNGKFEVAKLLLDAGADTEVMNKRYLTALMAACLNNTPKLVEALLKARADPNVFGNPLEGGMALQMAERRGNQRCAELIKESDQIWEMTKIREWAEVTVSMVSASPAEEAKVILSIRYAEVAPHLTDQGKLVVYRAIESQLRPIGRWPAT